ncbi:MAG: bifunctional hydroxymethylpyrimidine kinase/phosphomethylpyrimidine kinase [Pseudomonadales bacterium]
MAPTNNSSTPIVLSIAGSDSGGGAGIQADIKAISATGSYACTVITALTAQNTLGVSAIASIDQAFIEQQFDAVFSDIAVSAVKIGMLGDSQTIETVASALKQYRPTTVVLDPVMVATSGDMLLQNSALQTLITRLLPLADVITPNLPEALAMLGEPTDKRIADSAEMEQLCYRLEALGAKAVLIKGGHSDESQSTDYFYYRGEICRFSAARVDTQNTHGTGCTLSSSIASYLAQGQPMPQAIDSAKRYISAAIASADQLHIGQGHGPVHHFFHLAAPL